MATKESSDQLTFGEKVIQAREEMGLNVSEFARRMKVDRQLVAQWEAKKRCSISAQKLQVLVEATGKPASHWTGKETSGVPLVDEIEDSLAELPVNSAIREAGVEDPMAKTALSLLMKLPRETAMSVIEEAITRMSAHTKGPKIVPIKGA